MLTLLARRALARAPAPTQIAARSLASLSTTESALTYRGTSFPYTWLRDSCQCPACIHPSNKQKLHRTSDVPLDAAPRTGGVTTSERGVEVAWAADGHTSFYPAPFLARHAHGDADAPPIAWDRAALDGAGARDLTLPYAALETPAGLLRAITQLARYGLLFLTGVPTAQTAHATCEVRRLAERFGGQIRNTMYGEVRPRSCRFRVRSGF